MANCLKKFIDAILTTLFIGGLGCIGLFYDWQLKLALDIIREAWDDFWRST